MVNVDLLQAGSRAKCNFCVAPRKEMAYAALLGRRCGGDPWPAYHFCDQRPLDSTTTHRQQTLLDTPYFRVY
jgi:hypothetical protein